MSRKVQPDDVYSFLCDLEKLLNVHGYNKGVKFKRKRISRMSDTNWEYVLTVTAKKYETYTSLEAEDFKKYAKTDGIRAPLGTTFEWHGKRYKLSGYKRRARKYPILTTCLSNGNAYKFPARIVKSALDNQGLNRS